MRCFVTASGQEIVQHVIPCKSQSIRQTKKDTMLKDEAAASNVSMTALSILPEDYKVALSAEFKMAISTLETIINLEVVTLFNHVYCIIWSEVKNLLYAPLRMLTQIAVDTCGHILLVIMSPSCCYYATFLVRGVPHGDVIPYMNSGSSVDIHCMYSTAEFPTTGLVA